MDEPHVERPETTKYYPFITASRVEIRLPVSKSAFVKLRSDSAGFYAKANELIWSTD